VACKSLEKLGSCSKIFIKKLTFGGLQATQPTMYENAERLKFMLNCKCWSMILEDSLEQYRFYFFNKNNKNNKNNTKIDSNKLKRRRR
jgi:hypothetical protein